MKKLLTVLLITMVAFGAFANGQQEAAEAGPAEAQGRRYHSRRYRKPLLLPDGRGN